MNSDIKNYLIILFLFLLIDVPMLLFINTDMYMEQLRRINNGPMNIGENTIVGTIITYILLGFGLYYFVLSCNPKNDTVVTKGMLFGLIVYGVYDYTNLATINEFGSFEALVDTMWGTILCGLVSYTYINLNVTF